MKRVADNEAGADLFVVGGFVETVKKSCRQVLGVATMLEGGVRDPSRSPAVVHPTAVAPCDRPAPTRLT